ncbi:MAG: CDP-archaeol synthase [Candidatus Woesearchaeota archaeon]
MGFEQFLMLVLQSVYFLIPAYFANMSPPLAKKLGIMGYFTKPVDGGRLMNGKPLFGRNKTYRGFIVGIVGGMVGGLLQHLLYNIPFFNSVTVDGIAYNVLSFSLLIGALMGFGAIAGDLIESFFKRRLAIDPGERFIPWDQIDLVFGAYLFVLPLLYMYLSWVMFLYSIIATFFLHIMVNHLSYYMHIRKEKW